MLISLVGGRTHHFYWNFISTNAYGWKRLLYTKGLVLQSLIFLITLIFFSEIFTLIFFYYLSFFCCLIYYKYFCITSYTVVRLKFTRIFTWLVNDKIKTFGEAFRRDNNICIWVPHWEPDAEKILNRHVYDFG